MNRYNIHEASYGGFVFNKTSEILKSLTVFELCNQLDIYNKLVIRTVYGIVNAGRNSA